MIYSTSYGPGGFLSALERFLPVYLRDDDSCAIHLHGEDGQGELGLFSSSAAAQELMADLQQFSCHRFEITLWNSTLTPP